MSASERHSSIPAHVHCKICGKAIPPNREYCSVEHKDADSKAHQRARRLNRVFVFSLVILMVFIVLNAIRR